MTTSVLLGLLGASAAGFAAYWLNRMQRLGTTLIGFGTNFFDTLGIGNFAPTTALYRFTKLVPDELIPGTMNVGHTLPVVLMGFLFINSVEVEPVTLYTMIGAAVVQIPAATRQKNVIRIRRMLAGRKATLKRF